MTIGHADAREQFNRHAAHYAGSQPHSRGDSLRILSEWAALDQYKLGLDIGTGPGFTAFAVAEFCETVIASDIADGMLDQAREIATKRGLVNVRFETIDAHDIPYSNESIDLVTCRTAPHHFGNIPKFLSEVHRVLKSTGVFLLCDTTTSENAYLAEWHQRVEALRDPSHATAPSPSGWRTLIADAGFEITHSTPTQVDLTFWDWVKRSGSPADVVEGLHFDFGNASDAIKKEYGIRRVDVDDFAFYWPVFTCRTIKT